MARATIICRYRFLAHYWKNKLVWPFYAVVRAQQNEENRYMQQIKLDNDVGREWAMGKLCERDRTSPISEDSLMKTERWGRLRNKIACNNTHNNGTELFLAPMWNRTSRRRASTLALHSSVRKTRGNCFEWKIIKVNWCELANASRRKKAERGGKIEWRTSRGKNGRTFISCFPSPLVCGFFFETQTLLRL